MVKLNKIFNDDEPLSPTCESHNINSGKKPKPFNINVDSEIDITNSKKNQITSNKNKRKDNIKHISYLYQKCNNKDNKSNIVSDENQYKKANTQVMNSKIKEFKKDENRVLAAFLIIGIDRNGIDIIDDMDQLLLTPKIYYNYPFNTLERDMKLYILYYYI